MFSLLFLVLLCSSCLSAPTRIRSSYSMAVGKGGGTAYSTEKTGQLTNIKVWERPGSHIAGFQLCYDSICTKNIGAARGNLQEIELDKDERIVQIYGNHENYIHQLVFVTSAGRFLVVGHPAGSTFNFYPADRRAGLRLLSGRYNKVGITSMGAHWGDALSSP